MNGDQIAQLAYLSLWGLALAGAVFVTYRGRMGQAAQQAAIWALIFVGAIAQVQLVWMFGDLANASMAFPNLIAILALSGVVLAIHKKNGDPDTEDGDTVLLGSDGQPYVDKSAAPAE